MQEKIEMNNAEISKGLFEALAGQDDETVRRLCAPEFRALQNNGRPLDLDTLLRFNAGVGRIVTEFRYTDAVRAATATGFVEEHVVRGVLPNGEALEVAVCAIGEVKDGKVTILREYFDSKAAAGLVAALR